MRFGTTFAVTLAAGLVAGASPALAAADPIPVSISVSPAEGRPGDAVTVQVACEDTRLGVVSSAVLTVQALSRDPDGHQPWLLTGAGEVNADAHPGRYEVSVACGDQTPSTWFTVRSAQTGGGAQPTLE
ncbi:hypothetical protein BC739_003791 [Kutzneria viridogrisea]|nr:hypothetical protein [Kutzneria albida]MBA8926592.1 hypothetical protein [Kutzneria viridogrisea]